MAKRAKAKTSRSFKVSYLVVFGPEDSDLAEGTLWECPVGKEARWSTATGVVTGKVVSATLQDGVVEIVAEGVR